MHLSSFPHPGPTSTSHFLENVLMSRYPGSWCDHSHLITWIKLLKSQNLNMSKLVLNLDSVQINKIDLDRSLHSINKKNGDYDCAQDQFGNLLNI